MGRSLGGRRWLLWLLRWGEGGGTAGEWLVVLLCSSFWFALRLDRLGLGFLLWASMGIRMDQKGPEGRSIAGGKETVAGWLI